MLRMSSIEFFTVNRIAKIKAVGIRRDFKQVGLGRDLSNKSSRPIRESLIQLVQYNSRFDTLNVGTYGSSCNTTLF